MGDSITERLELHHGCDSEGPWYGVQISFLKQTHYKGLHQLLSDMIRMFFGNVHLLMCGFWLRMGQE